LLHAGTFSMPYLFHCSNMFGIYIPSLSTIYLRSISSVPTSLGVISASLYASCMGVLASLFSPSIGFLLPRYSILFFGLFVFTFVACSLASLDFSFSFPPSSPLLVLSYPSILVLASGLLPVGDLLGFLFALFLWFGFINPSSSCCILVFSTSCCLLRGHYLLGFHVHDIFCI
jgi:hypothetical protein